MPALFALSSRDARASATNKNGTLHEPRTRTKYVYDGLGRRVAKESSATSCASGTVTKLYWRSLSGDSVAETDGSGSTTNAAYTEYVFFAGRRIASRNGSGAIFYYFADQLGSTRTITTGSGTGQTPGQLCYDADFTPYGQEISYTARLQTTACPPNYKFTGYERDSETGLDYAFARYYSSRLGRFLSTDPLGGAIGDLQSHNAYAYVTNNPTNGTDPLGLCGPLGGNLQGGARSPCPDGDGPGYMGGPCGLDCAGGAGFAGMLSGGAYAGSCSAEFQGCLNNGSGGYIGITGTGIFNCNTPNVCTQLSGGGSVTYNYTPGGQVCATFGGITTCSDPIPGRLDVITTDSSDSWGLWDTIRSLLPPLSISGSWLFGPIVPGVVHWGPTVQVVYIPPSNRTCVSGGLAVGTFGKSVSAGPLVLGDVNNAEGILKGFSWAGNVQTSPAIGAQTISNLSGKLGGPTLSNAPGASFSGTYGACFGGN